MLAAPRSRLRTLHPPWTCASTWEQSILAEAQTLWPTGRLEMEYTTIFDGRHSTPAHPATYWARLVWKMQLDAPHDAYTTVLHVHLSIPKEYANDQWRYRIRCALLQSLHKLVEKKLQKKFPSSDLAGCMIKEWSNMADRKAPPAYHPSD
ncbi:hypothetical protein SLS54_004537 [Diplodia seriata]